MPTLASASHTSSFCHTNPKAQTHAHRVNTLSGHYTNDANEKVCTFTGLLWEMNPGPLALQTVKRDRASNLCFFWRLRQYVWTTPCRVCTLCVHVQPCRVHRAPLVTRLPPPIFTSPCSSPFNDQCITVESDTKVGNTRCYCHHLQTYNTPSEDV